MFGNRLGWSLALGILAFGIYIGFLTWRAGQTTPATGWVAATVRPIVTPVGAASAIPQDQPGDAASLYAEAIDDYRNNAAEYDALESGRMRQPASPLAGIAALRRALPRQTMNYFRRAPQQIVNYDSDKLPLQALVHVGKVACLQAMDEMRQDNLEEAGDDFGAVFSLGLKLFEERVNYAELSAGEELMDLGGKGLQLVAKRLGNTDMVLSLAALDADRLSRYETEIQPVWAVVDSIDQSTMGAHAGDMFELAEDKNAELVWRVEAILHLGRLKYDASRRADEVAAQQVLEKMADDPSEEPAVRVAAAAARDLTLEQYRTLH